MVGFPVRTRGRRARRARVVGAAALLAALAAIAVTAAVTAPATANSRTTHPSTDGRAKGSSAWRLSTDAYRPADYRSQPYVGNGYLAQRLPATGTGYQGDLGDTGWPLYAPRYAGAFAAGFYHRDGGLEYLAALPTWSTLELGVGGAQLRPGAAASEISGYRQTVDLRRATVTTALTWTPTPGRATRVAFDVLSHRPTAGLGLVRARITPSWSGSLDVTSLLDGRGARRTDAVSRGTDLATDTSRVTVQAAGTKGKLTQSATLVPGRGTVFAARAAVAPEDEPRTAGERVAIPVEAGRTYEVVKYVGVGEDVGSADAVNARARNAGWAALLRSHERAWRQLWRPALATPGRPELQTAVNSSLYSLYSSVREGQSWSLGPSGLSSETYAGQVYWDADTWMFPTLLALHPELARSVVEYRYRTLEQARHNATAIGAEGAVWPWTAGPGGLCSDVGPCGGYQDHLQNEIALAQWQYYAATGDRDWLRTRGYPVLKSIAEFWTGRVTKGDDGAYHVNKVHGADEYARDVNDHALTNAGAVVALRHAADAARTLGEDVPDAWRDVADRLYVPRDADGSHPEYAGYAGQKIKQADTVLLTYPYGYARGADAQADLDRYAPVTDPDGPAMTDSVHAVVAARLGAPGCQTDTYLDRAWRPFVKAPFQQFSEARGDKAGDNAGAPAFTFLTGAGGFLQVFPHGLAGLRADDPDALRLDPLLTPSLADGVRLENLAWQGRRIAVGIGPERTRVSLVSGAPLTVRLPDGTHRLRAGEPLLTPTRRPDRTPTDDLARCRPATAESEAPGGYAQAAVDGSRATAWTPETSQAQAQAQAQAQDQDQDQDRAALTVGLRRPVQLARAAVEFGAERPTLVRLEGLVPGEGWRPLAESAPPASGPLTLTLPTGRKVSEVRVTVTAGAKPPQISEVRLYR
ncbi:glycosyl hydrolase family 65 protein [Streptomyces sp. NPDC059009]|uniref:glycosyl hydrolase family 65 protein n=1 Tax=Streptomyces sp. NPDC059009 TaxID=3346694 RepID=UPI0036CC9825